MATAPLASGVPGDVVFDPNEPESERDAQIAKIATLIAQPRGEPIESIRQGLRKVVGSRPMILLVIALLQAPPGELVEKLGSADMGEREAAALELAARGRLVYPALRTALRSADADLRARAEEIAYGFGIDPETHRTWEETWAAYLKEPAEDTRGPLLRLARRAKAPVLAFLRRIDEGLLKQAPDCAAAGKLNPLSPSAAEWAVAAEVIRTVLRDKPYCEEKMCRAVMQEGDDRAWVLYAWGVHMLQRGAARPDVLGAFRSGLSLCPGSYYAGQMRGFVAALERMIEEEGKARPAKPLALMTGAEQAEHWLFQLRDVCASQISGPGRCHIPSARHPAPGNLLALGKTAIPAIIECLGDTRLTRSIAYRRDFDLDRKVLTYHDAAVQLLEDTVGPVIEAYAEPSEDLQNAEVLRKVYRRWWAASNEDEPVDWWRAAVERDGPHDRSRAATALYEAEGDKAVLSLLRGLAKSGTAGRADLIHLLSRLRREAIMPVFEKLLAERPTGSLLRALAVAMNAHGSTAGLERIRDMVGSAASSDELRFGFHTLAESGRFEFVRVVLDGLKDAKAVESALLALNSWSPANDHERGAVLQALKPVLSMRACWEGKTWRHCDAAAERLASWYPREVAFDSKGAEARRDVQIARIAAWIR